VSDADPDFRTVAFTVLGIERLSAGALLGLAIVEVDIGGVVLVLQGVQIIRGGNGTIEARSPRFRDAAGHWRSAVILPETLQAALADEILAGFAPAKD
jgi:hypothetical protein